MVSLAMVVSDGFGVMLRRHLPATLVAQAAAGRVLVGPRTATLLSGLFDLEPVGPLQLKGVAEPVEASYLGNPQAGSE